MPKICALIPTYNEAGTICPLVTAIRKYIPDVLVIDDGSSDRTAPLAEQALAKVIYNPINHGKGATLRQGFEQILKQDFEWVLTMDGDGQHSPSEIPLFLQEIQKKDTALVIGNRMDGKGKMPALRRATNWGMSFLISQLVRQRIPDTQCGYRLIHRELLQKAGIQSRRFEVESELVIQAARMGFKISSVPIHAIYNGSTSQIHPFLDGIRFFQLLARYR